MDFYGEDVLACPDEAGWHIGAADLGLVVPANGAGGRGVGADRTGGEVRAFDLGAGGSEYPPQRAGVSYGFFGNPLQIGFIQTPTPRFANDASSGVLGFVEGTKFSVDRGFYETAFDLVITTTTLIPDHDIASNWVASAQAGGCPGCAAPFGFQGDPNANLDRDGMNALIEYALGTSDNQFENIIYNATLQSFTTGGGTDNYLTLTFQRNLHAQNALTISPQISDNLTTWEGMPNVVFVSETDNGNGTTTMVYRSASPIGTSNRKFIRLRISQ